LLEHKLEIAANGNTMFLIFQLFLLSLVKMIECNFRKIGENQRQINSFWSMAAKSATFWALRKDFLIAFGTACADGIIEAWTCSLYQESVSMDRRPSFPGC